MNREKRKRLIEKIKQGKNEGRQSGLKKRIEALEEALNLDI